jgi:hypothetical protein
MGPIFGAAAIILATVVMVFLIAGIGVPCMEGPWPNCLFEDGTILKDYQTLISGLLALAAVAGLYWQTRVQIDLDRNMTERLLRSETRAREDKEAARREETLAMFFELDLGLRDFIVGLTANSPPTIERAGERVPLAILKIASRNYALATWLHLQFSRTKAAAESSASGVLRNAKTVAVAELHIDIVSAWIEKFQTELVDSRGNITPRQVDGSHFRKRAAEMGYPDKFLCLMHYFS